MLRNITGMMSDRASVMKSYHKAMDSMRQQTLCTEESIEFLHCNAHFFLGLSSSCETILKEMEKGKVLGRDKLPVFKTWSSAESASVRYIRTGCDVLGPRGDEKSGWKLSRTSQVSEATASTTFFKGLRCFTFISRR